MDIETKVNYVKLLQLYIINIKRDMEDSLELCEKLYEESTEPEFKALFKNIELTMREYIKGIHSKY